MTSLESPEMPKLTVDRATAADAVAVDSLLDAAAAWQQSRGFPMWTPGRFDVEVRQTIADGSLYVGRREAVLTVASTARRWSCARSAGA